jgi:hypothetical protein
VSKGYCATEPKRRLANIHHDSVTVSIALPKVKRCLLVTLTRCPEVTAHSGLVIATSTQTFVKAHAQVPESISVALCRRLAKPEHGPLGILRNPLTVTIA